MAERTGRKAEMLWDCSHCGSKGIRARFRECPNCGSSRTGSTYIGENVEERILSEEDKKLFTGVPDWKCDFCGKMNKSSNDTCWSCGSPKDMHTKDYFDVQNEEKVKEKERRDEEVHDRLVREETDRHQNINTNSISTSHNEQNSISISFLDRFKQLLPMLLGVTGVLLFFGLLMFLFMPKNDTLTVQSLAWERNIEIQIEKTFNESDWTLPSSARLNYTRSEIHHYDKVIDHYETVTKTEYKREIVGYNTYWKDNGDGTADEMKEPIYDNVPYEVTVQEPKYRQEPVYRTKYYYEIDRYVHSRDVPTKGVGHTEEWGSYELKNKEREGKRSEKYSFVATNKKGKVDTYYADYDLWGTLNAGDIINVKVSIGNHVSLVED